MKRESETQDVESQKEEEAFTRNKTELRDCFSNMNLFLSEGIVKLQVLGSGVVSRDHGMGFFLVGCFSLIVNVQATQFLHPIPENWTRDFGPRCNPWGEQPVSLQNWAVLGVSM